MQTLAVKACRPVSVTNYPRPVTNHPQIAPAAVTICLRWCDNLPFHRAVLHRVIDRGGGGVTTFVAVTLRQGLPHDEYTAYKFPTTKIQSTYCAVQ